MGFAVKYTTPVNLVTLKGCLSPCLCRSTNSIIDKLKQLCHKGIRHFKFVDDPFLESPRNDKWFGNFANKIKRRELKDILLKLTVNNRQNK